MTKHLLIKGTLAAIVLGCLVLAGCSDDCIITTSAAGSSEPLSEIQRMFPATAGYQAVYQVVQSNGTSQIVTNTVGERVVFGYTMAHEMHIRSSSGERSTTYFLFTDSSLYFYEYWSDNPEKILSLPLTIGSTWDKGDPIDGTIITDTTATADTTDNETDDLKDGGDDPTDPKPGDGDGGSLGKNFPGNNSDLFTIVERQTLTLSNGDVYSGVVKVRNDGTLTNYFWFAPSVGLIRWVLDADPINNFVGTEVGELIQSINKMASELDEHDRVLEIERQKYFQQEKMAAIGVLAAGIAHEVGNPIAAISAKAIHNRLKDSNMNDAQLVAWDNFFSLICERAFGMKTVEEDKDLIKKAEQ